MRDIAKIIEDDRKGKELSQTERQIAVAYVQGKYDAVRELKIINNSNANEVLNKIRAEIEDLDIFYDNDYFSSNKDTMFKCSDVLQIIDKYRKEVKE